MALFKDAFGFKKRKRTTPNKKEHNPQKVLK